MDRYQKLEQITNGINAAYKIKTATNSLNREDCENGQETNNVELLLQMLSVIAEYYPEPHRNTLSNNLKKSTVYHNTYKNLKHHIKNMQTSRSADSNEFARTLELVKPVLDKDRRSLIEKMLRIHEILKS